MADFLTHLFLPLTAAYVLKPDWFKSPMYLLLGGFGLLSDFDKFLGMQGLLHSLVTLVPILGVGVLVEHRLFRRSRYSWLIAAIVLSHLVLDFVDGGPIPLLFPFIEKGVGLQYPAKLVFGEGLLNVLVRGPLVILRTPTPKSGFHTFGFIDGVGVAIALVFMVIYVVLEWQATRT